MLPFFLSWFITTNVFSEEHYSIEILSWRFGTSLSQGKEGNSKCGKGEKKNQGQCMAIPDEAKEKTERTLECKHNLR